MARKRKRSHRRKRNVFPAGAIANRPRRRRRRRRSNPVVRYASRRGNFRRRYRRNPGRTTFPALQGILNDTMYAGLGYISTRLVGNMVMPAIGLGDQPFVKIAAKGAIAYVTAWGVGQFIGMRFFTPVFLGGATEVIQDIVKEYIAPMVPALAADQLSSYYRLPMVASPNANLSAYYGNDLSDDVLN